MKGNIGEAWGECTGEAGALESGIFIFVLFFSDLIGQQLNFSVVCFFFLRQLGYLCWTFPGLPTSNANMKILQANQVTYNAALYSHTNRVVFQLVEVNQKKKEK